MRLNLSNEHLITSLNFYFFPCFFVAFVGGLTNGRSGLGFEFHLVALADLGAHSVRCLFALVLLNL